MRGYLAFSLEQTLPLMAIQFRRKLKACRVHPIKVATLNSSEGHEPMTAVRTSATSERVTRPAAAATTERAATGRNVYMLGKIAAARAAGANTGRAATATRPR